LDGCALSVPCHTPGEAPVGLMIAGLAMQDQSILNVGAAIESLLAADGRATHTLRARSTTIA
jgi:aspartyl-tRNA(Asn)/glutamyl-tRNA(Gln) amidotransferase subunit A